MAVVLAPRLFERARQSGPSGKPKPLSLARAAAVCRDVVARTTSACIWAPLGAFLERRAYSRSPGRSQALSALYEAARRNEISAAEGIERVTRINSLKVRFLGDKVLQRTAWKVADQLGWETTFDAEFVALTQLQADAFITSDSDLARAVSGLVKTATIDALRTA